MLFSKFQETTLKRKHSYDYAPFRQQKGVKRRRVTTTVSITTQLESTNTQSPDTHTQLSPYHFCSPEREDLSSFLADDRIIRSTKRRLIFARKASCLVSSLNKPLSFPKEPKLSTREASRKRPLSQVLDDSIEEAIIKGKPANKKHRTALSDSMQEDFYLTDDGDETDGECDKSADDIFVKKSNSVVKPSACNKLNGELKGECDLASCRKHSNPDKHPKCCSSQYIECEFRSKPTACLTEMEQLVDHWEMDDNLFQAKEYPNVLKEVDYGNGHSPSVYLYDETLLTLCNRQQHTLHIDRTFNLANCYVTMFVFRNTNLIDTRSKKKYSPLMMGPVMLHFDTEIETYTRFFEYVKQKTCIQYDFKPELNRKILKKDTVIAGAMKTVFGTGVSLCDIHYQHSFARRTLKEKVKCYDSLKKVIEQVAMWMKGERAESEQCLQKRSIWKMVPRAKVYMCQYMDKPFPMKYLDDLSLSPE